MSKHTPGPWTVGYRVILADHPVADAYSGFSTEEERLYYDGYLIAESVSPSNARLIAAAPLLLAAAQKAMDECCDLIATDAGNALQAAIEAATGEKA